MDLNKLELLYAFGSLLILLKDFFELKNFTSLMLNSGLNFYIEFFISLSLFINFSWLNYTDFEADLLAEYLELDFFILKVYFFKSSISFLAKFILLSLFSFWICEFSCYILLFEALVSLFTLLLKIDLPNDGSSFYPDASLPLMKYFRWMLKPDFTCEFFY